MMHSLKSLVCCIRGLLHSFYTFPDPRPVGASDQEGGRKMCRRQGNGFFFFRCLTLPSYLRHFQFSSRSFPVRTWHRPICFRLVPFCFGFTYRFFNSGHVCPQILEMIKFALEKSTETGDTDWLLSHRQQHEKHNINVAPGSLFHASRAQHRITPINCCH